jgi:hypothetical protein
MKQSGVLGTPGAGHALVFDGPCAGRFYDVSLRDFGVDNSDVHGLRGTFRVGRHPWAAWFFAAEALLHHGGRETGPGGRRVGNRVSTYRKTYDWLPERRQLLENVGRVSGGTVAPPLGRRDQANPRLRAVARLPWAI